MRGPSKEVSALSLHARVCLIPHARVCLVPHVLLLLDVCKTNRSFCQAQIVIQRKS